MDTDVRALVIIHDALHECAIEQWTKIILNPDLTNEFQEFSYARYCSGTAKKWKFTLYNRCVKLQNNYLQCQMIVNAAGTIFCQNDGG